MNGYNICYLLWRQFCLHQLFTWSIEGLMYCVIETVGSESIGLRLDELVQRLSKGEFYSILKNIAGSECEKPKDFLYHFGLTDIPNESFSLRIQKELPFSDKISENGLIQIKPETLAGNTARYLSLLAVLYMKWRGCPNDTGFMYLKSHAGRELWVDFAFHEIDKWFENQDTWEKVLSRIVLTFILDQHDRVMYEKRRLDSCWLHRAENRVLKDQDYGPRWRSSRHRNVISILNDLKLLNINKDKSISLSQEGKNLLKFFLKNR